MREAGVQRAALHERREAGVRLGAVSEREVPLGRASVDPGEQAPAHPEIPLGGGPLVERRPGDPLLEQGAAVPREHSRRGARLEPRDQPRDRGCLLIALEHPPLERAAVGEAEADSTLSNALSMSRLFSLRRDEAVSEVRKVALVVERWKEHFASVGVSRGDIDLYAEQIDRPFLRDQRAEFVRPAPSRRRTET